MTNTLKDKVIIVTGAGGAIGGGIARLAAAHGARVVANDIGGSVGGEGGDAGPAQRVVEEIRAAGGDAVASTSSVASWDGAQAMVQTALDAFGRVDGVVNNAGILRDAIFHKMSPQDFEAVVQVHLLGSFYLSRAVAPLFREQGSGAMVHMTSTSGLIGNIGQANYAAAKLGVVGLSKSIALDMQRFGVRSNCISPFAWSRMIGSIPTATPEQQARVERLKRMTPEKIAPVAAFLLSDAAAEVNGQIFAVRANEVFLMGQSRPLRSIQRDGGWSPEQLAERLVPAFRDSFYALEVSADVFSWDPF
ncbi:MAG: SDR family oxidoreductase [Immundisolibacter sp.]|uniref:SDR family oxidoreductase n=1 Tax=Immundisolibacter sp. TaxID=1934948 RepID=UPI003EE20D25